jgi:hypothetical protein
VQHTGSSISFGDINGDGLSDIIVGEPLGGTSGTGIWGTGYVYVIFGNSSNQYSPSLSTTAAVDGNTGFVIHGITNLDNTGNSVGSADVNNDGFDDIIIGAYGGDGPSDSMSDVGETYVVYGSATLGSTGSFDLSTLSVTTGVTIYGAEAGDKSGCSVSGAGDVNGDGYDDIIIGAYLADSTTSSSSTAGFGGKSYVVFGGSSLPSVISLGNLVGSDGFVIHGELAKDYCGWSVSGAGDLNGDGYDDIVIGCPQSQKATPNGKSQIVLGSATVGSSGSVDEGDMTGFGTTGCVWIGDDSQKAGYSVSRVGDMNGDGYDDVAVTGPYGSGSTGKAHVLFGSVNFCTSASNNFLDLTGLDGFDIKGSKKGDYLGWSVSGAGDVNDDGYSDIIVGAPLQNKGWISNGVAYVIFGSGTVGSSSKINVDDLDASSALYYYGRQANDFIAKVVSGGGDINGDGKDDLLIGAPESDELFVVLSYKSPTSSPTAPSSYPTNIPTITHLPSALPTAYPSSTSPPTQLPTLPNTVSFAPTGRPVPSPTFSRPPTPSPTSVPTVLCVPGTYFDGLDCFPCATGYYSNFNVTDHGVYPTACTFCDPGKYSVGTGNSYCDECGSGKLSNADRTGCRDCEAGEYAKDSTECISCESGKYAPQALTNECLECGPGSHTNRVTKATTCTVCDAGRYSHSNTSLSCPTCMKGEYSSSGASNCTTCSSGSYADKEGSSSCTLCPSGRVAPSSHSTNCTNCDTGTYQGASGQSACIDCDIGKYAATSEATSCSNCELGKSSRLGSDDCRLAADGYYFISSSVYSRQASSVCEPHSTCLGGLKTPIPIEGYWVDHSSLEFLGDIYKCSRSTCARGEQGSSCWNMSHFNSSDCLNIQCKYGSTGPLCGSCMKGFVYKSTIDSCEKCGAAREVSLMVFFMALFCGGVVALSLHWIKVRGGSNVFVEFLRQLESGSLKVSVLTSSTSLVHHYFYMTLLYIFTHVNNDTYIVTHAHMKI